MIFSDKRISMVKPILDWFTSMDMKTCLILTFSLAQLSVQASDISDVFDNTQLQRQIARVYGPDSLKRLNAWSALLRKTAGSTDVEKLNLVNQFFNQLIYITDVGLWGKTDFWASPIEFVGAKGGDCEDYSISKYYSLLDLGIPEKKLRIIYVKHLALDQFHMVVGYYPTPKAVPLILDNTEFDIVPANKRRDLVPVYSFNAGNLWLMGQRKQGKRVGSANKLKEWRKMSNRLQVDRLTKPIKVL